MRVKVTELTPSQKAELEALTDLSDEEIDTNDIPEVLEWRNPRRGLFAGSPSRKAEPKKRLKLSGESGREKLVTDFARWVASCAVPIFPPEDVYVALDAVDFAPLFRVELGPIGAEEFRAWHKSAIAEMQDAQPKLNVGWAANTNSLNLWQERVDPL